MTPEQRLTQMEKLLETTIKLTHKNTQKIDAIAVRSKVRTIFLTAEGAESAERKARESKYKIVIELP